MQSKNSVTSSEVGQSTLDTMDEDYLKELFEVGRPPLGTTPECHLKKLFEIVDYDPWGAVWEKLTSTQRRGLCLVANVSIENGEHHENWDNFTLADCERLQRAVTKFCSIAEKVKRAIGASNAVRGGEEV